MHFSHHQRDFFFFIIIISRVLSSLFIPLLPHIICRFSLRRQLLSLHRRRLYAMYNVYLYTRIHIYIYIIHLHCITFFATIVIAADITSNSDYSSSIIYPPTTRHCRCKDPLKSFLRVYIKYRYIIYLPYMRESDNKILYIPYTDDIR
jgi:hypothetical protein